MPPGPATSPPPVALADQRVALLLPLTGPQAALGNAMLRAAQLALGDSGPQLDVRDTGGIPDGAANATRAALEAHDTMILGPLTGPETAAAAAVAGRTPILAFTSDRSQGHPGVWTLGLEPEQQVERLVDALAAHGKGRLVAVLPDNAFGSALAAGLTRSAGRLAAPPDIRRYVTGKGPDLDAALRGASDYATRHGVVQAHIKAAHDAGDEAGEQAARAEPVPPLAFDALMLAEAGPLLRAVGRDLGADDITAAGVQVVGPATWMREATGVPGLAGAWFAAPDPVAREDFVRAYTARYNAPPQPIADLAYDAARLARTALEDPAGLTRSQGFIGVDGPLVLLPDGQVRRSLALFAVAPGGAQVLEPGPALNAGS